MLSKSKTKSKDNSKISFWELVWMGFSFTASGVTFTSAFGGVISDSKSGIGWWIFLVIILGSLFIASTSWAFKKCSSFYGSDENGGAYIYARSSFGRFWGWMIGFIQYVTLPTSIIVCIIAMIDQDIGYLIPSHVALIGYGHKYQHLILNSIGTLIFFMASFSIYFGMKGLKLSITIATAIQWLSTAIIVGCAIYMFVCNGTSELTKHTNTQHHRFNFMNFNNAIVMFIYFYVGFETYACIGKNLKNPEKTIGKAIMLVLFFVTLFYLIVTFIFIGAVGIDNFKNNSTLNGIKEGENPALYISQKVLGVTGIITIVISVFTTKLNSIIQSSLYSGAMLEPLSKEGYISEEVSKLAKNNIPFRASFVNTLITLILIIAILIIPNIFSSDIDFSTAIGFSSIFSIIIYISVILSALKLHFNKKLKLKYWEFIAMLIAIISMSYLILSYFLNIFLSFKEVNSNFVINIIQLILLFGLIIFAIIWYYTYYLPKYNKRILEKPNLQLILDSKFTKQ